MDQLTSRQQLVLKKLIEEYIKTGKPISSSFLEKKSVFAVCSATLRIDLGELTDKGFLKKSHLSGGRVPTDKGYRFFINSFIKNSRPSAGFFDAVRQIMEEDKEEAKTWFEFSQKLSDFSQGLGVVWNRRIGFPLVNGWEEILKWPEFQDFNYLKKFTFFVENFEEELESISLENEPIKVFIGKELGLRNEDFCAIVGICRPQENQEIRVAILGPKRMNFNHNISLLDSLIMVLENQF